MSGLLVFGLLFAVIIVLLCLVAAGDVIWSKQSIGGYVGLSGSVQTHVIPLSDHKTTAKVLFGTAPKSTPPVVLIGSCPLDQRMWDPVLNEVTKMIADGAPNIPTFITYDSRGCGTADFPTAERLPGIEQWSKDLRELLSRLEIDRVALAGWGFGGLVAQHFALNNPAMVSRLHVFSISSTDSDGAGDLNALIGKLEGWRQQNPQVTYLTLHETVVQEILRKWFDTEELDADIYEVCQDSLREVSVSEYISTLRMIRDSTWLLPLWTSQAAVPFKTYIMSAASDKFAHPTGAIDLFNAMKQGSGGKWVTMDVKQGLHGYALAHADETALELCGS